MSKLSDILTGQSANLVLIGKINLAFVLPAHFKRHGPYKIADLSQLVTPYGITDWLISSIWPETFSYTTHEAFATSMP